MAENKRHFIVKVLVVIMTILAIVGLIAMILSVINSYVDPLKFVWTSFFGLAFWEIFLFNVLIFIILLLLWSNKVWIAVVSLLIAFVGLQKSYSVGKADAGGDLRVMSYNVGRFVPMGKKCPKSDVANDIASIVRKQHPDVLCCQEFSGFNPDITRTECISEFAKMTDFNYIYFHKKSNFCGNVVFSKYPISALPEESVFSKEEVFGAVAEIDAGSKGRFYIADVHLVSYLITGEEIDFLTESSNNPQYDENYGKSIIHKLKDAFIKRSVQTRDVLAAMPHPDKPVIVCGDFNDTPLSYNYRQMKRAGFIDGFIAAGKGVGTTYAGKLPMLRIDYVWCNAFVQPTHFKRIRQTASDHYPVIMDFDLKD